MVVLIGICVLQFALVVRYVRAGLRAYRAENALRDAVFARFWC
jgi:hypothetical protein